MIRIIRQWKARRDLARHRKSNIARMATAPKRDQWGRFTKGKIA